MICSKCGAENPEGSKFCANCGSPFEVPAQEEPKVLSPNEAAYTRYGEEPRPVPVNEDHFPPDTQPPVQQPVVQPQQTQQYQQPNGAQAPYGQNANPYYQNAQPPKKKNKGCLIAIIIVLIIALLFGALVAVLGIVGKRAISDIGNEITNFDFNITDSYEYDAMEGVGYGKGSIADNIYINEWADLKLIIPSDYHNLSADDYANMESDNTDCGLYIENVNLDSLAIIFTEASAFSDVNSITDYVAALIQSVEDNYKNKYDNVSIVSGSGTDTKIAGRTFFAESITAVRDGVTVVDTLYGCKIDDYYCVIWMTGDTEEYNNSFVQNITVVSE
jgi:hypothetical protein